MTLSPTPDGRLYGASRAWRDQVRALFPRTWHLYPEGPLPTAGRAQPWALLPEALDEPLLILGGSDGQAQLRSNVCTHRGHLVALEPQSARALRCRYHGRRFDADGRCVAAPSFDRRPDFPRAEDHLAEVSAKRFGPWLFASLEPESELDLLALEGRLGHLPWHRLQFDPDGAREHVIAAHWALYCDNYLEGFHIPFVHKALTQSVVMSSYRTELLPMGTLQWCEAAPDEPAFEAPEGHVDAGRRIAAYYLFVFPGAMLNVYPWGVSVNVVLPRDAQRTVVRYQTWVWDASLRHRGAGADLDGVEGEDQAVVLTTQAGVRSRLYRGGQYEPEQEAGVAHFHRLIARYAPWRTS